MALLVACASQNKDDPAPAGTTAVESEVDSGPGGADDSAGPWTAPGCGDGIVDPGELCDDGASNSDTVADACRTDCVPASCGDGVVDAGETCDDGNTVAADGCSPDCVDETGLIEVEPNDSWDEPNALGDALSVVGALPAGDRDCFQLDASACGALAATVTGACTGSVAVSLHSPGGNMTASGTATEEACAAIDPDTAAGARFLEEGSWAVCVSSPTEDDLPAYTLSLALFTSDEVSYELPDDEDPDGDGVPDQCDSDDDGDNIPDLIDPCPDVPDGPDAPPFSLSSTGFIRSWLAAGPYTETTSAEGCSPSDDALVHPTDDALADPYVAEAAGTLFWSVLLSGTDRIEFLTDYGGVSAPREIYTAVWVRGAAGPATLAMGPDDGVRAWFDGVEVMDVSGCQGTNIDQFQSEVAFTGDWQLLLIKVRDQGGGWGNYTRFLDDSGSPLTSIEVALTPDGSPLPSTDTDGDGIGDACDPTPAG
jgi:cysteine-rich repeat protein